MAFLSPHVEDNMKMLDDIHECLLDLRKLVNCMIKQPGQKNIVQEFMYKLKTLEKDMYFVSVKLKELYKRNDTLHKTLANEREKGRKRITKIQQLEAQLNSVEFKLKVIRIRANQMKTQDVGLQIETNQQYIDPFDFDASEIPAGVLVTMNNLKNTTLTTLNVIKNMFAGTIFTDIVTDDGDVGDPIEGLTPRTSKDLLAVINELKDRNEKLIETIQTKDKMLEELSLHTPQSPPSSSRSSQRNSEYESIKSNREVPNEARHRNENTDHGDNYKEYPLNVIRSMKSSLTSIRNGDWRRDLPKEKEHEKPMTFNQKFKRIREELHMRHHNMQQKMDEYFNAE